MTRPDLTLLSLNLPHRPSTSAGRRDAKEDRDKWTFLQWPEAVACASGDRAVQAPGATIPTARQAGSVGRRHGTPSGPLANVLGDGSIGLRQTPNGGPVKERRYLLAHASIATMSSGIRNCPSAIS